MKPTTQPPGTERYRDEQRDDDKPKVAGHDWKDADKRIDPDDQRDQQDPDEVADTDIESGGEQAGMKRGEKPRKAKDREP